MPLVDRSSQSGSEYEMTAILDKHLQRNSEQQLEGILTACVRVQLCMRALSLCTSVRTCVFVCVYTHVGERYMSALSI